MILFLGKNLLIVLVEVGFRDLKGYAVKASFRSLRTGSVRLRMRFGGITVDSGASRGELTSTSRSVSGNDAL
jgi:hypothetical protein